MLLTEQEIKAIDWMQGGLQFARAIESAVLEKLKAQEPFCHYWNYKDMEDGIIIGQHFAEGEAEEQGYIPLYKHPLPPDDVVQEPDKTKIECVTGAIYKHISGELYPREVIAAAQYIVHRYCTTPDDVVRDAERYRWLVDNSYDRDGFLQFQVWKHSWEPHSQTGIPIEWKCRVRGPAIDAAIDGDMEKTK